MRCPRWSAFAVAVALAFTFIQPAYCQQEASRVRILLVLDTLDRMGETWGLDGDNMQALFERAFTKQGLVKGKHYTIDMFTGKKVTPRQVLDYYKTLQVGPNEALVFYYSGHGGYHGKKGHFMALTLGHQELFRNDILQAMDAKKPRLRVVLTDCCANLAAGALQGFEPAGVIQPGVDGGPAKPRAALREPPATVVARKEFKPLVVAPPPRPEMPVRKLPRARKLEPPSRVEANNSKKPSATKRAVRKEPEALVSKYVLLQTPKGAVAFHEVLDKMDGKIIRQLFFQHKGVVDINGCPKGLVSQGTLEWGGSLFTLAFIHLQAEDFAKLDPNGDGFIEWQEIFSPWISLTQRINRHVARGDANPYIQTPQVWQLKASK